MTVGETPFSGRSWRPACSFANEGLDSAQVAASVRDLIEIARHECGFGQADDVYPQIRGGPLTDDALQRQFFSERFDHPFHASLVLDARAFVVVTEHVAGCNLLFIDESPRIQNDMSNMDIDSRKGAVGPNRE